MGFNITYKRIQKVKRANSVFRPSDRNGESRKLNFEQKNFASRTTEIRGIVIPKTIKVVGPRINLTFRQVKG